MESLMPASAISPVIISASSAICIRSSADLPRPIVPKTGAAYFNAPPACKTSVLLIA